jgi:SAM-dependent methyltransferase
MLPVAEQLSQGRLVCPKTHQPLHVVGSELETADGRRRYPYADGLPVLLADPGRALGYRARHGEAMVREYEVPPTWRRRWIAAVDRRLARQGDLRSAAAEAAFGSVVAVQPPDALCLSIGGGPLRVHPNLVNLNLGAFANVDVAGDAYALPYAGGAVDAVHCEAVLEHLEHPRRAVREMFRVLKPGGELFAATAFLQGFHAYPDHYQNFTRVGHDRLFARQGFEILSSGACVGPTFMLSDLASLYFRTYLPGRLLGRLAQRLVVLASLVFRPIDRRLNRTPDAHLLASTVYTHARKPLAASASPPAGSGSRR